MDMRSAGAIVRLSCFKRPLCGDVMPVNWSSNLDAAATSCLQCHALASFSGMINAFGSAPPFAPSPRSLVQLLVHPSRALPAGGSVEAVLR
eukprot:TRINITY_DN59176_c0_g1_i1.p1 TRINITY_DN59176_c0_g1~~TRINITY_DN59176_c0_g1_i1.p1  ORF type:complete len:105 (-),score=10.79 TRINITY_DN59176_c0_g1_i1:134-406(-)